MEVCLNDKKQMMMTLKKLDRHITQTFEKRTEISLTRYEILVSLLEKDCVTQKVLQQSLAIDQAAITRHLKILEQQQYIERKRNEKNNREVLVTISNKGRAALESCTMFKDQFLDNLYNGFSNSELKQLKQSLARLSDNIKKL
ncbi:MarR family transcriptional regulator [Bacillus sp. AGMB 02131]|uniref:MarR family transcriptional regulator n=1 Tax=Peribacillus faecalis TaxID=2772559 RepID=A0A927HAB6_9BACI|nr:MarR family transcriptional regulator [Peribacillus faecalis]MBD3107377.1 MarR family transcriptional regulator [Peribacillus faecalis]